jgi:DNA-binding CsgD family transcriptional regulator
MTELTETVATGPPELIGRCEPWQRLVAALAPGRVTMITARPGLGKTALLEAMLKYVRNNGFRAIWLRGDATVPLDLAGQLLLSLRSELRHLPRPSRTVALAAAGLTAPGRPTETGPLLAAVQASLTRAAPIVLLVDDVHLIDPAAQAVLSGLIRDPGPATLLLAGPPDSLAGVPVLALGELDVSDSARVLDAQPDPPIGRVRLEILHRARGNPRDLVESARAAAGCRSLGPRRCGSCAACGPGTGETAAEALEAAASVAERQGELLEAAGLWQDAARWSSTGAARRYGAAIRLAGEIGEPDWIAELYRQLVQLRPGADELVRATGIAAEALSRSGRQREAFTLIEAAGGAAELIRIAARITERSGLPEHRQRLATWLAPDNRGGSASSINYALTVLDPARTFDLKGISPDDPRDQLAAALIDWHHDRSDQAVAGFEKVMAALAERSAPALGAEVFPALISALISTGRWAAADHLIGQAGRQFAVLDQRQVRHEVEALQALLHALRGDGAAAVARVEATWPLVDTEENRFTHALMLRALGLAALGMGEFQTGYGYLRSLFDADGEPLHSFVSPRAVAELATIAVRSGHAAEAARVVARVAAGAPPSARMRLLLHQSIAIVDENEDAEEHFRLAITDPAAPEWPLELAVAQLHHGEWLRRNRRPLDARAVLAPALDAFVELGAQTLTELARRELRAAGAETGSPPAGLTPQEHEVAVLAGRGLRNREIAAQLMISHRTVGSHLYRVYAKLGIAGRRGLRDALAPERRLQSSD